MQENKDLPEYVNDNRTEEMKIDSQLSMLVKAQVLNLTDVDLTIKQLIEKRSFHKLKFATFCDRSNNWSDEVVHQATKCNFYSGLLDTKLESECATWLWNYIKNSTKPNDPLPFRTRHNYCNHSDQDTWIWKIGYWKLLDSEIVECVARSQKRLPDGVIMTDIGRPVRRCEFCNGTRLHPLDIETYKVDREVARAVRFGSYQNINIDDE